MMAANLNRASGYSSASLMPGSAHNASNVSTTTLLNALHLAFTSGQPHRLDATATLVVNTYATTIQPNANGREGGTVDVELARRAWEHARRRAEDGCVVLA
jgi:chitin synthase